MLEGLDQIDWSRLPHAHGPATDIPVLLRRLADGSGDDSEQAMGDLFETIWHQGTVYEATAAAVPFLIELAADPASPHRLNLLCLLDAIAEGWLDGQKYPQSPGKFVPPRQARQRAIDCGHQQAAHAAVAAGRTELFELLSDEDAQVRVASAFVLALLIGYAAEVAEMLLDAADREADEVCRSVLQFALAALAMNAALPALTDVVVRRLTSVFNEPPSETVALGAGIALLQLGREEVISRVLHLARPRLVSDSGLFLAIHWPRCGELYSLVERSLECAPREQLQWIVEGLNHADRAVRSTALGLGVHLCETYRWGPAELAPRYAELIERADADERKLVVQQIRSLGAAGAALLHSFEHHRLADVREHAAVQRKTFEAERQRRESQLVRQRPDPLPSLAELRHTLAAQQDSPRWHNVELRDAIIQLGFHGPAAAEAAESVRALTQHENAWMRAHAICTLWRITQDAERIVPLVQANLQPDPSVLLLLSCVQPMGSSARALAPELRRQLADPRRFFPPHCGDTCGLDESFCAACAAALASIDAPG
jgi:hypothetical protein